MNMIIEWFVTTVVIVTSIATTTGLITIVMGSLKPWFLRLFLNKRLKHFEGFILLPGHNF